MGGIWDDGGLLYPRTATLRVSPDDHRSYCDAYATRANLESLIKAQIGSQISLDDYDAVGIVADESVLSHNWVGDGSFLADRLARTPRN